MRLAVLLLIVFVAKSSSQILQVKCGDEKCERPSNKAVTTLRYTPDKPYKLQIYAVNAEVEIFGMTDDLYYIRHGKNYGFLPKNHLREKARGNYPFNVEVDISNKRIDQQMREQNFLHEFLKTTTGSVNQLDELKVNETLEEKPGSVETPPPPPAELPQRNVVTDAGLSDPDAPKVEKLLPSETTEESNDSGIDDEDDDDDDEYEDEEENSNEDSRKVVEEEQPKLIAIPPSKDIDAEKGDKSVDIEKIEEKLQPLPVPASVVEEVNTEDHNETNKTVPEFKKMEETQHLTEPRINERSIPIDLNNSELEVNASLLLEVKDIPKVTDEITALNKSETEPIAKDNPQLEIVQQEVAKEIPEIPSAPAAVTEDISEITTANPMSSELPDVPFQFETPQLNETAEMPPVVDHELPDKNMHNEIPVTTEVLDIPEDPKITEETTLPLLPVTEETAPPLVTISEDIAPPPVIIPEEVAPPLIVTKEDAPPLTVTEDVALPQVTIPKEVAPPLTVTEEILPPLTVMEEPPPSINQQIPSIPEPDALLQRFNEKLGNRGQEKTGKGTVEPLHRPETVDHHHEDHDHSEKSPEVHDKLPESNLIEEKETGFFSGLYSKFFSDKDDSEQHFHDDAKVENAFNPSPETNADSGFCEKIDSENCPQSLKSQRENIVKPVKNIDENDWKTADEYIRKMLNETLGMMDLIISMGLTALTVLIFTLGYYCISKARKEGPFIAKLNEMERHLMASVKENDILKGDLMGTRQKLMNIEDNSFGSNDMVIALRKDLELSEQMKNKLSEKIISLEKELEAAAEDGLELNRMVSELLSNQSGSESIISSVEDLQRQLNEQQETIASMNETLAAKSRENSELQVQLSEINGKFHGDFQTFKHQIDANALERSNLQIELENLKRESDVQVNQLIEERNGEVTRLNSELTSYAKNYEDTKKSLNIAESKVQALEETLQTVKKSPQGVAFKDLFDVAELKADLLAVSKEKSTLQEQLQTEVDSRKLLEDRVKSVIEEMSNLKKEFGVAEKEKLEAQTRLEVLSTYFREKETQLQQDLSIKEARWMKQQGETTSTVEKVQALNIEIQTLKSQNDSLRAEIEAQVTAHKLNISSHEAQSHAAWLNARQAERKLEESRMESAALRRRLTSIAENPAGASEHINGLTGMINDTINAIPSPIRVESPNNTNNLPPAPIMMPPFLPQGFMSGAPPPFLPPPPFMPGEMVPPLGRLMSPPPKRFTPTMRDDRDRYSPRGRGRYSPDSRYDDYTAFETETDYSPPPSPSPPRRGYNSPSDRSKKSKGVSPISRRK